MSPNPLKHFQEIPYEELEELNLEAKRRQLDRVHPEEMREIYLKYLTEASALKAVTVCFCDLEGRMHMLDYDKKFLLKSWDNLTFDGSSVRGFSQVRESDLRLEIDWGSFRWMPSDIFGPGKVLVFGIIKDRDGSFYHSDMRGQLKQLSDNLANDGLRANIAVECEGFLFKGLHAEQKYDSQIGFELVDTGGYFHSLPTEALKQFIDTLAEVQRAIGFENEKDHPEVAPSQFELNYSYTEALIAADQVQLYKLTSRQVAANMGHTASFLPKPFQGINGNGMHTNLSIQRNGQNLFFDAEGEEGLSPMAWQFIDRILHYAKDMCLILNSSVNAYRRLDPEYEAPNQIKSSAVDRTSMVRIPLGNEKSARIEVRTVAPDANPYLAFYTILRAGLDEPIGLVVPAGERERHHELLPTNIFDAIEHFSNSQFIDNIIGANVKEKYAERKLLASERCPLLFGNIVKDGEILFHHEVTNQYLWSQF
ncbi:MAG: glutamine synthetase family protein [Fimbriimonadaceae bacterium]